jgi:hypothetical protein
VGGVRGGGIQPSEYGFQNSLYILENLVIPKPKDSKPLFLKPSIANLIFSYRLSVLSTLDFKDHFVLETDKIDDVMTDRGLPAKLESA